MMQSLRSPIAQCWDIMHCMNTRHTQVWVCQSPLTEAPSGTIHTLSPAPQQKAHPACGMVTSRVCRGDDLLCLERRYQLADLHTQGNMQVSHAMHPGQHMTYWAYWAQGCVIFAHLERKAPAEGMLTCGCSTIYPPQQSVLGGQAHQVLAYTSGCQSCQSVRCLVPLTPTRWQEDSALPVAQVLEPIQCPMNGCWLHHSLE